MQRLVATSGITPGTTSALTAKFGPPPPRRRRGPLNVPPSISSSCFLGWVLDLQGRDGRTRPWKLRGSGCHQRPGRHREGTATRWHHPMHHHAGMRALFRSVGNDFNHVHTQHSDSVPVQFIRKCLSYFPHPDAHSISHPSSCVSFLLFCCRFWDTLSAKIKIKTRINFHLIRSSRSSFADHKRKFPLTITLIGSETAEIGDVCCFSGMLQV